MNIILLIISTVLAILFFVWKRKDAFSNKIFKVLSVILFGIFLFRLFTTNDAIDRVFNAFLYDIETPINASETWLFTPGMTAFILFLRWFTSITLILIVIQPYINNKFITKTAAVLGSITSVLNLIFFDYNLIAMLGKVDYTVFKSYQFFLEMSLTLFISLSLLLFNIFSKQYRFVFKKLPNLFLFLIGAMFAVMPQTILFNLFGYYGEVPDEFTASHLFVIVMPVVIMLLVYNIMKNKTQAEKNALITYVVFAGFTQYFYMRRETMAALPLHLCNTAIILMLFAVVFKIKQFFYFSYFANVLGAIAAIFLPNYTSDLFGFTVIHYGYNHLYALITPILGVALKTFDRPVLSHMVKAILVFTVYFITVVFLNAWFNNYTSVDYFFTYSDFLTDMFGIKEIQYDYVVEFTYNGLTFKFFWLFQTLFYFIFIIMMFASWYVYDAIFQMNDQRARLKIRRQQMKYDQLRLNELLEGRNPSEPMNPGGIDMIKISHFSKRYGQSERYAVKDFSLEVHGGEIFGFLGHNGAGKSTTIKSIVGIQSITEGEIEVCGYSIKSQPLEVKLRVGYVSDNHAVYEKLTGREYIHYVADLYRVPKELRDERLTVLATKLSLIDAIDQMIKSYSHGMKQKLVVIASLIHEPKVWILDEPLTGLDPISSFQIKEIMKEHAAKGNIVFFSSHVIEVVEKICTKIAVITQGKLTGIYDVSVLKDKNVSLEELYMRGVSHV